MGAVFKNTLSQTKPKQIYETKPTKLNASKQIYWTNLLNPIFWSRFIEPILPNKIYLKIYWFISNKENLPNPIYKNQIYKWNLWIYIYPTKFIHQIWLLHTLGMRTHITTKISNFQKLSKIAFDHVKISQQGILKGSCMIFYKILLFPPIFLWSPL